MKNIAASIILLAAASLSACSAAGQADAREAAASMSANAQGCFMDMNFNTTAAVDDWFVVNDGVMGGLSKGRINLAGDHMRFDGFVNTNGGGFTSIRRRMEPEFFAGAEGVRLKVRPDARTYSLTFRTGQSWRGRNVSWQAQLPEIPVGEWAEVTVPFSSLRPTVFGRDVRVDTFDKSDIRQMGFIIADGIDGDFSVDLAGVDCIRG